MLLEEAHNKSVAGGTTKAEVLAVVAAARNVPPHNPFASTASEAYRCLRPTHTSPATSEEVTANADGIVCHLAGLQTMRLKDERQPDCHVNVHRRVAAMGLK